MHPSRFLGSCALLASILLFAACGDSSAPAGDDFGSGGNSFGPQGCGPTGQVCNPGTFCDGSTCVQECMTDMECGGGACCMTAGKMGCYDTSSAQNHCGGCGMGCAGTQTCQLGMCTDLVCNGGFPPNQGGGNDNGGGFDDDAGMGDDDAGMADPTPNQPVMTPNGCAAGEECRRNQGGTPVCFCGQNPPCAAGEVCNAGMCLCGGVTCQMNQTCCGAGCADLMTDSFNCGACGNACGAGLSCIGGFCRCPDGQTECNGACVDINSDRANCGACGNACAATSTCSGGTCNCAEGADYLDCNGVCNPVDDPANCGACGNVCMNDNNTVSCYAKQDDQGNDLPVDCHCFNDSYSRCGGGDCVRLAQGQPNGDSVEHCGACGNTCDGGANVCDAGSCRCPDPADTECNETCVDLRWDENNCGACGLACDDGEQCNDGKCTCDAAESADPAHPYGFCPAGGGDYSCQTIDDEINCGFACQQCRGASFCDTSGNVNTYACTCDDGAQTYCGDPASPCVNLETDPDNCGSCGFACEDGDACDAGECQCGVGQDYCEGDDGNYACVPTNTDVNNCGGCGIACDVDGGEVCCNGACVGPTDGALGMKSSCGSCNTSCPDDPGGLFVSARAGVCNWTCNGAEHTGYVCGYEDAVVNSCP